MSPLPFELFLALRYLRPKRAFVSVITLICIIGVMLGVSVLIIVISVMTGFDRQLRDRIIGFSAHIRIESDVPFEDYESVMAVIERQTRVKGVAPYVMGPVMLRTQPADGHKRVMPAVVRGIDPTLEAKVSVLPKSVDVGEFNVRGNGLLLGRGLASRLRASIGDNLAVYSIRDLEKMETSRRDGTEDVVLPGDYTVQGILDVGHPEYNETFVVCSLGNAQDLFGYGSSIQGLSVMVDDPDWATAVRSDLQTLLGPNYRLSTWKEDNATILEALLVEKNVMFYLLFFIMIVAAFGITSALITFVVRKTREIGLLKALGATNPQVMALFLSQSLVVGVVGVAAGFGLGMLAVAYRNDFLFLMRRFTGLELFPSSVYVFTELPALVIPSDVAIICGGSLLICLMAGLIPAWNAGRLRPVEALRYE